MEAALASGYQPQLTAVNHWPVAIETHSANHPDARHLCTSIDEINPRTLYAPGELDLLWASPECTHHSVARGGRPINEQSRATAWCVPRWADALLPPIILVENVPEFTTWGPIDSRGRPIKRRKGELFDAWLNNLRAIGYRVDWRVLCAADYGDPTTRRRLFIQAVRGRRKVVWPDRTHAPVELLDATRPLKPWVAAREIIDWDLPAKSIYDRAKPLSKNTMRRIWEGLRKFGLIEPLILSAGGPECAARPVSKPVGTVLTRDHRALAEPFLVCMEHNGSVRSANRPMPTITTAKGGAIAVVDPFLVELRGTSERQLAATARSVDAPLPTVSAGGGHSGLVSPFLIQVAHGDKAGQPGGRGRSVHATLPTVCGHRGDIALCDPALLPQQSGGTLRSINEPAPTISTSGAVALVEPFLVKYYGTAGAQRVSDPLDAVTTKDRHALVRPEVMIDGERYTLDIRFRMLQPSELGRAQGFSIGYRFAGNKTEQVKQIGNAVPRHLARAIVCAALTQNPDVSWLA
jgi:DNA (cytosine-5)-methyltransferase 1